MQKHTLDDEDQMSGVQRNEAAIRLMAEWLEEDRTASPDDEASWERLKTELDRDPTLDTSAVSMTSNVLLDTCVLGL